MKKLIQKTTTCLLSPEYFKIVMEAASLWATLTYSQTYAYMAWYWENLSKVNGYILTGFKTNWPDNTKFSSGNELIDFFFKVPVEVIFVSEELYKKITSIKSNGCIVEVTEYGKARTKNNGFKRIYSCSVATDFVKELSEEELRKIKSVDAFTGGVFE